MEDKKKRAKEIVGLYSIWDLWYDERPGLRERELEMRKKHTGVVVENESNCNGNSNDNDEEMESAIYVGFDPSEDGSGIYEDDTDEADKSGPGVTTSILTIL